MTLQIRRGLAANLPASPADGELLYATDTNKLYVGDGGTAQEISGGTGGGLANVVEDLTPQLGGALDVNGYKIVSSSNGNIEIDPDGTGNVILHGNLTIDNNGNFTKTGQLNISPTLLTSFGSNNSSIDGNVFITRNTHSATYGAGFTFAQHHAIADAVNFGFYRTRGTGLVPTAVLNGDDLADISFFAWDGTARAGGASISATVEGTPVTGHIPTKISFGTDNGTVSAIRAELSPAGIWKVNTVQALTASTALSFGSMVKLQSYASESAANTAVGSTPASGMMYYDSTANTIKVYSSSSWQTAGTGGVSSLTSIKTVTGDYTVVTGDHSYYIRANSSATITITLVSDATEAIPIGTTIIVGRVGIGEVLFVAGAGATVYSSGQQDIAMQWGKVSIIKTAANTWEMDGAVTA
jgi:hypothetical protein